MPRILSELLREPFGPFKDSDILAPTLKSARKKPLCLRNVALEENGNVVGLDTTEPYQPEHVNYRKINVSGVLVIADLSWLSDAGRRRVERALRERDGPESALTLERLYGTKTNRRNGKPGFAIKVTISAIKNMTVGYLTTTDLPNGLYIKTVDRNRWYSIESLDYVTFQRSRKFLGRYRALRVLNDVIKYDEENSEQPTLQADRTAVWFARLYTRQMRAMNSENEPAVHLSSDSSDYESDYDRMAHYNQNDRRIKPYRDRTLRHESVKDVLGSLREHAAWLIHSQEQRTHKRTRLFDPVIWKYWLNRGHDADVIFTDNEDDRMDVDEEEYEWNREEQTGSAVRGNKRRASQLSPEPPASSNGRRGRPPRSDPKPATPPPEDDYDSPDQRDYDPDFSPPSTPDWNPSSEASFPSRPPTPDSPTLVQRVRDIGTILYYEPEPPKSAVWWCPVKGCYHHIDLLDLQEEDVVCLDRETARRLRIHKGWYIRQDWVMEAFKQMAKAHYAEHLGQAGVRMLWDRWRRPRLSYLLDPPPVGLSERQEGPSRVKQEDA